MNSKALLAESETDAPASSAVHTAAQQIDDASNAAKKSGKKRKKKLVSRMNMWIRRIHLFSGLFMLPWVLLYGFTALLFNHPTYMTDSRTEIENVSVPAEHLAQFPTAEQLAEGAVAAAAGALNEAETDSVIELVPDSAVFTRQAFGTTSGEDEDVTLVLDLNSGNGYLRTRTSEPEEDSDESEEDEVSLEDGLKVSLDSNPVSQFKAQISDLIGESDLEEISVRSLPAVEFNAIVDGEEMRLRFVKQTQRGRASSDEADTESYAGELSIVGANPRDMSVRSYLLRLHMAHGYPVQKNSRWFWAIAVDLMFASMVFWGLSGVIMWWQIKRTRRIGFILLLASAVAAAWLAIGMHWQLVNG
ncbi:MAG: PepSY domain-containing protein [Planctomycetota bacterium]